MSHAVQFVFHPEPTMEVKFTPNERGSCNESYVLPKLEEVEAKINVFEEFGEGINTCKIVKGSVQVNSLLGAAKEEAVKLQNLFPQPNDYHALYKCNPNCTEPLQYDGVRSSVVLTLTTGMPNKNEDATNPSKSFSKMFRASIATVGYSQLVTKEIWVVVTGSADVTRTIPMAFPEYWPLTVLHDPPGGNSFASYENVKVTGDITFAYTKFREIWGPKLGAWVTFQPKAEVCAGLGAMACQKAMAARNYHGGDKDFMNGRVLEYEDDKGVKFGLDISYTTSSSKKHAGRMSDMYLIPSLIIKFELVAMISFNLTTCKPQKQDTWEFSLGPGSQEKAFSWMSHYDIVHDQIPIVKKSLAESTNRLAILENMTSPTPEETQEKESLPEKVKKLQDAVDGWEKLIALDAVTRSLAKNHTPSMKIQNWKKNEYSGLAPEDLVANAKKLTDYPNFDIAPTPEAAPEPLFKAGQGEFSSLADGVAAVEGAVEDTKAWAERGGTYSKITGAPTAPTSPTPIGTQDDAGDFEFDSFDSPTPPTIKAAESPTTEEYKAIQDARNPPTQPEEKLKFTDEEKKWSLQKKVW